MASSCFGCACVCVVIGCFGICACRSHWNGCMTVVIWCSGVVLCVDRCKFASCCCEPHCHGCMNVAWALFWEEAGARNLVFFRVKWLQATMKGTSSVRRLRLGSVGRFFLPQCNGGFKLLWVCLCVRSYRVFWNLCLQIWNGCMIALEWLHDVVQGALFGRKHCNGCMSCTMFWGGSRNLVFFRVKWLQATMKGTSSVRRLRLRSVGRFFFCRSVTVASSCFGCACVCVVIGCFGICACRSHWNGCMMLQGLCFWEEAGARNLVFFRVKWLQATMKGTSSVRRLRLRSVYRFFLPQCNGGFKLLWVWLCVRSYRVFWNLCLQIALEWLRQGCLPPRLHA